MRAGRFWYDIRGDGDRFANPAGGFMFDAPQMTPLEPFQNWHTNLATLPKRLQMAPSR